MQSRTSCFNAAVFRKNLTRFAPIWGSYTLGLVIALLMMVVNAGQGRDFWPVEHMGEMSLFMSLVNCGYALVTAQALFGDLYVSRSCYALHALPLRRETWYMTNLISGLVFSLIPTLVMTLLSLPVAAGSAVVNGWQIPLANLAVINTQYVFFFGLAVVCVFCAGNRLGMAALYGVANFGSWLLGAANELICGPMYFGVELNTWNFNKYSPVMWMMDDPLVEFGDYYQLHRIWEDGGKAQPFAIGFTWNPVWGYLGACALVGVVLLAVGLVLYRRRKLECAGDFLAFRALEPIASVVFALVAAVAAKGAFEILKDGSDTSDYYISLAVGLVIGWFGIRMLLERTTRVFRKKSFLGLAALALTCALGIFIAWQDPLGLEDWVPQVQEVESVSFQYNDLECTDPEDIAAIIRLHEDALRQHLERGDGYGYDMVLKEGVTEEEAGPEDYRYKTYVRFTYHMKDGSEETRRYDVWVDSEGGEIVKKLSSRVEFLIKRYGVEFRIDEVDNIGVYHSRLPGDMWDREDLMELWAAIQADAEAGRLSQERWFHTGYFIYQDGYGPFDREPREETSVSLNLNGSDNWFNIEVYADSTETLKWLESRGLLTQLGITPVPTDYVYRYGG